MIREHRGALEYDFRARFGTGLGVIGQGMTLAEAARLTKILRADPASALAAAVEGWDHPVSREAAILMDLWDLEAMKSGAKKPPRYTRPWRSEGSAQQFGNAEGRSRAEVLAILGRVDPPTP